MANKKVDEAKVQRILFEMTMAFGKRIRPELLSDDAVAAFQRHFDKSVRAALKHGTDWEAEHPTKSGHTWRTFVLKLVRKVGRRLSGAHTVKKKVDEATLIDTVVSVGEENGCPPDGPAIVARWCSDFIRPLPHASKTPKARAKRRT